MSKDLVSIMSDMFGGKISSEEAAIKMYKSFYGTNNNALEVIDNKKIFYKMGVMCGETLYMTYKFNKFSKMIEKADEINNKYKSDMRYCCFVIQAFKDDTYDFEKSCFYQDKINVSSVKENAEFVAEKIIKAFK